MMRASVVGTDGGRSAHDQQTFGVDEPLVTLCPRRSWQRGGLSPPVIRDSSLLAAKPLLISPSRRPGHRGRTTTRSPMTAFDGDIASSQRDRTARSAKRHRRRIGAWRLARCSAARPAQRDDSTRPWSACAEERRRQGDEDPCCRSSGNRQNFQHSPHHSGRTGAPSARSAAAATDGLRTGYHSSNRWPRIPPCPRQP